MWQRDTYTKETNGRLAHTLNYELSCQNNLMLNAVKEQTERKTTISEMPSDQMGREASLCWS